MALLSDSVAMPTSVSTGAATDTSRMADKSLIVTGTFSGTYQAQISNDGTNFVNEGAAFTTAGTIEITKPVLWVRFNCTVYASGTPSAIVCGARD